MTSSPVLEVIVPPRTRGNHAPTAGVTRIPPPASVLLPERFTSMSSLVVLKRSVLTVMSDAGV
jgi:hypothetical protein